MGIKINGKLVAGSVPGPAGADGKDGKSAYQAAIDGGYTKSEEEFNTALSNLGNNSQIEDIKNKIGTESDVDTQPTLFGRLAQLKKVLLEKLAEVLTKVTGIDGKIGDIGDPAGEESLVGLVKSVNKTVENGDGFYRYSKTDIKKRITDWVILSGSHDTYFNAKLTTLHAEKNGTVYVKIRSRDQGIVSFAVYDKSDFVLANAPDQSKLATSFYPSINNEYLYFTIEYNNNYDPTTVEKEWIFPVTAGHDYTFLYFGNITTEAKLLEFLLGYTDTKEA